MKVLAIAMALLLGLGAGCAQKETAAPMSAAAEGAQRLERRAATAYSKGDLQGAQKDYQTAAAVYASLALEEPLAIAQLNMAKIEGESGRVAQGLALAEAVLRKANTGAGSGAQLLSKDVQLMAHGRAAALSLALQKTTDAQKHLSAADQLCANSCVAASALAALGAELWMLSGNNTAAMTASNSALQLAISPADKANALRSRAAAGLAQGGSTMDVAIGDAEQALAIDQLLGASARVIADLDLLETAYNRKGNTQQANRYAAMRQAAQTARDQLRLK